MTVVFAGLRSLDDQAEDIRRGITCARVNEWVAGAQKGAWLLYGIGYSASTAAGAGVARRLFELSQAGLVMLVAPRVRPDSADFPHDYRAIRTGLCVPPGFPALPPVVTVHRVATSKVPARKP